MEGTPAASTRQRTPKPRKSARFRASNPRSPSTPHAHSPPSSPAPPRQAVTFLAIPVCGVKAFVDLSLEHEHGEDPPAYPYLRIRSKEFPWGDSGLFETEH